jgi:hypothetical protein
MRKISGLLYAIQDILGSHPILGNMGSALILDLSLSLSLREFRLEIPKGRILIWKVEDSLLGWDSGSVPRSMEESDVTLRRKRYLLLTVVEPDNCHWRGR